MSDEHSNEIWDEAFACLQIMVNSHSAALLRVENKKAELAAMLLQANNML